LSDALGRRPGPVGDLMLGEPVGVRHARAAGPGVTRARDPRRVT
jgi:hypothetical protein